MARTLLLSLIAVSLSFLFVGVGVAEKPEVAPVAQEEEATQAAPVCSAEGGSEMSFPVTAEDLLPSTNIEDCTGDPACPPGCWCVKVRDTIYCGGC